MPMKILTGILLFSFLFLFTTDSVNAQVKSAGMSAIALAPQTKEQVVDNRAKALRAYLEKYNSPLADSSETFIAAADANKLDWKFVAAIAGLESGYGHHIPFNSYNAWGWGVYGTNVHRFTSWDEGIETISQGLRERYMDKWGANDVHAIGKFYASSPTWSERVLANMESIDAFYLNYSQNSITTLSLSI